MLQRWGRASLTLCILHILTDDLNVATSLSMRGAL